MELTFAGVTPRFVNDDHHWFATEIKEKSMNDITLIVGPTETVLLNVCMFLTLLSKLSNFKELNEEN